MTPPKKWPENAEWARQDSIAKLAQIKSKILYVIDREESPERIRELARVNEEITQVQTWLREARST